MKSLKLSVIVLIAVFLVSIVATVPAAMANQNQNQPQTTQFQMFGNTPSTPLIMPTLPVKVTWQEFIQVFNFTALKQFFSINLALNQWLDSTAVKATNFVDNYPNHFRTLLPDEIGFHVDTTYT